MHHFSLTITCLLPLIYLAACNPRIPDSSQKVEDAPPVGELEPLADQMDSSIQIRPLEDPENRVRYPMNGSMWGKRGWNNLSNMWGKRGWNNLSNMWGKRETSDLPPYWGKRGWNNLSNVWGKRGWNNLSNVWGKRGWNNLSGVWGKRSGNRDDGSKRTTNWNNLKSVWGKRDADWNIPTMWDVVPPAEDTYQGIYIPDQM